MKDNMNLLLSSFLRQQVQHLRTLWRWPEVGVQKQEPRTIFISLLTCPTANVKECLQAWQTATEQVCDQTVTMQVNGASWHVGMGETKNTMSYS